MKINREIICDTELISRYYDNDLDPEEYSDIKDHIDSCEKCRKSLAEYGRLTDKLKLTIDEPAEYDTLKIENRVIESIRRKNRAWWVRLADQLFVRRILIPAAITASIAILVTTFYIDNSDQGPGAIITSLSSSESVVIMHTEATNQPIIWVSENG